MLAGDDDHNDGLKRQVSFRWTDSPIRKELNYQHPHRQTANEHMHIIYVGDSRGNQTASSKLATLT